MHNLNNTMIAIKHSLYFHFISISNDFIGEGFTYAFFGGDMANNDRNTGSSSMSMLEDGIS